MALFIKKDINVDCYELPVMLALNFYTSNKRNYVPVNSSILFYTIYGRFPKKSDNRAMEHINQGFKSLIKKRIIHIVDKSGDTFLVDKEDIFVDYMMHSFVMIELEEMHKIFQSKIRFKFDLFYFFYRAVDCINNDTKSWTVSGDVTVDRHWCNSQATSDRYFKNLEELHLLYIFRAQQRLKDTNQYHALIYGRWKDSDAVNDYAENNRHLTRRKTYKINYGAIRQKYNYFLLNGPGKKSMGEMEELLLDMIAYNEKKEDKVDLAPLEDYIKEHGGNSNPKEVSTAEFLTQGMFMDDDDDVI